MKHLAALAVLTLLPGCFASTPKGLDLAFTSYAQSPVVMTAFRVNDETPVPGPQVIQGLADLRRPAVEAGAMLLDMPQGTEDTLALQVEWVELLTHEAYSAEIDVPVEALRISQPGYAHMMPVFGPGGLLVVASDRAPAADDPGELRDVARVCGTRAPARDVDYSTDPGALPMLREILDYDRPAGVGTGCR